MFADDIDDDEYDNEIVEEDQSQGYQALLDPDDEGNFTMEGEEEEDEEDIEPPQEEEDEEEEEQDEVPVDDGVEKPFSCKLCSVSFVKFEAYRDHFISTEHRYKRRDEKRRLGEGCVIETSPVEIFVNLLLYNKIPFENIQIDIQPVDFSINGSLEYNNTKYEHQHAPSLNDLYQTLVNKFNQDNEKHQLKMPTQSFFVSREINRKEPDHVWTVQLYCDDTGKSDEKIVKEVLDYCVYKCVEPERERLIAHSIQTWRMFHRQETKPGFWCDICKQCFRKRKAIISHFETSEKHENNLKRLPPYRRAVQHSLFTGRSINEFVPMDRLDYYRKRVNAYRIPPSNKTMKNAYYCTFCKRTFESAFTLEKHLGWKGHRDILRKRRQNELDNLARLATYLNFNQLSHEQRNGGIQQMAKTPDEYRSRYSLEPVTVESIQEDIKRFDTHLAQQLMQNIHNQQGNINNNNNHNNRFNHSNNRGRGRGRGGGRQPFRGQTFRPRGGPFHQQNFQDFHSEQYYRPTNYQPRFFNNNNNSNFNNQANQFYSNPNYHLPTSFRPPNPNFNQSNNNKRPYPQNNNNNNNNNYYSPRQSWPNKKPRFDRPMPYQQQSPSNRIDYRHIANQNNYQQQ